MGDVWVPGWTIRRFTDPKSFIACSNMVACAHTQVGSYEGSWSWGNRDGNPYPQSYIRCDGEGINAWPVNLKGAANLEGNPYVWAIETEDVNPRCFPAWSLSCGDVPAWTDAQVQTLIEGMAWWCIRFRRPPVLIPDARPGRVGLAYHRFGVPNSPEWVTGADQWTRSRGKCCPDWRRIAQFKSEVVPGVQALVDGTGEDMPLSDTDLARINSIVHNQLVQVVLRSSEADAQFRDDPWKHEITLPDSSVHRAEQVLRDARVIARRAEEEAKTAKAAAEACLEILSAQGDS